MKHRNRSGWIALAFLVVLAMAGMLLIRQRSAAQVSGSRDVTEKHIQHETLPPSDAHRS